MPCLDSPMRPGLCSRRSSVQLFIVERPIVIVRRRAMRMIGPIPTGSS